MAKYLDQTGLTYFWGKVKGWVNSHDHPVGSVYITISSDFNPADQWGGTWSKIAEGQCLIQSGNNYVLGSTGGEENHAIVADEMAYHGHNAGKVYTWRLGNIGVSASSIDKNSSYQVLYVDKSSNSTSTISNTNQVGKGAAHNNMQPYLAVNIWKRTA